MSDDLGFIRGTIWNWQALILALFLPVGAALFGNAFVPDEAMGWYENLNHPWYKLPLWGSVLVALLVYIGYGVVLYRTHNQRMRQAVVLSVAVLFGNEIWNLAFFGTRNLTLTFGVTVIFAFLVLVQTANVRQQDSLSFGISLVYLVWVVLYDLPWLYQLSVAN